MSKILENWKKKIEKNAFKSELTYTDKKGKEHTETVYFKRSSLPVVGDWQRIYPPVDENGKINKMNLWFGGKKNLIKTLIVLGIVTMVVLQFMENYNLLGQAIECCNRCNAINLFP